MGRVQDAMKRAADESEARTQGTSRQTPDPFPDEAGVDAEPSGAAEVDSVAAPEPVAVAEPPAPPDPDEMRPGEAEPPAAESPSAAGHPLMQRIPTNMAAKVVIDSHMMASSREQYRRLAAALHHAQEATGLRVVMIASAVAGEGKSLTASNLALTFSESYQRSVLLVDGDLRRPSLHTMFQIDGSTGLSEALRSVDDVELAVYQVSDRLAVLPAGQPTSDPMAGLTSGRMRRILDEARQGFDWVFIDTPPVGLLSDANLLSAMVDGTVLVVRADHTPYHLVKRAVDAIGPDRLLGTVLNQAKSLPLHGYAYDYYRYYAAPRAEAAPGH